jgi:hypothetical protein
MAENYFSPPPYSRNPISSVAKTQASLLAVIENSSKTVAICWVCYNFLLKNIVQKHAFKYSLLQIFDV